MHEEGSNIFLKTRGYGWLEVIYTFAILSILITILNNQFALGLLNGGGFSLAKVTAVLCLVSSIAGLFKLNIAESIVFIYLTTAIVVYPRADFIEFCKALFFYIPQVLFWVVPNQILSEIF
jgi:hypothetical protein